MRAWIASGKEDWCRPLPRPSTRTLPDAITFGGALLLIVLPDETPVRSLHVAAWFAQRAD